MALRVAINGFGRIGRNILRAIAESGRKDIEVVGINDLGPVETNAHLLRFTPCRPVPRHRHRRTTVTHVRQSHDLESQARLNRVAASIRRGFITVP